MANAFNNKKLHFIIGIGRSGTTILTKLLNKYKNVHCLPEANFLVFFLYHYKNKTTFTATDINLLFEEIELYRLSHPWVGWDFNVQEAKKEIHNLISKNSSITYQELCKLIYEKIKVVGADKSNAEMLIDKNPSYTIFSNHIQSELPQSKFIWIIRDYRANVLSRKQSIFLKSPNIAYNATRWKLYNKAANKLYQNNKDKTILIKYEDLVLKNEQESNRLTQFLNIKPLFEDIDFEKKQTINLDSFNISSRYKDRFVKKYSDLNKTLNSDRLDAWKEQLSEKEIKICEVICSSFAKKIGYKSSLRISQYDKIKTIIICLPSILKGYLDVYKDKVLYYFPVKIKLNRLKKKYIELELV